MGVKIHPRHKIVSEARSQIVQPIADAVKKYDLTWGELMSILAGEMQEWAWLQIKDERKTEEDEEDGR